MSRPRSTRSSSRSRAKKAASPAAIAVVTGHWQRLRAALPARQAEPAFIHCSRHKDSCVALARGHSMRCTLLCKQPRIVRVEGFLTRDEASSIIALTQEASWLHNAAEGAQARKVAGRSNKWCCIGNKSPVLTSAIERLLSEPERAEAFGAKGRERMLASFSISAMSQGNVNVYRAVMAARSGA